MVKWKKSKLLSQAFGKTNGFKKMKGFKKRHKFKSTTGSRILATGTKRFAQKTATVARQKYGEFKLKKPKEIGTVRY